MSHTVVFPKHTREPKSMLPFFIVWTGQAFSLLGSQLVQFALIWWLAQTSGSARVLTLASLVGLLPPVLLGPFAGALVDRWNRRAVMMAADSIIALATGLLAILFALDVAQVWHIYALMFVRATGAAFHWPAMQASTTLMVPERHLSRVAGLNQGLRGGANIVSPPLAVLLLEAVSTQGVLAVDVVTALLAIVPLFFVAIPQPAREAETRTTAASVLADMRAGLRFVWRWTGMALLVAVIALLHLLAMPAFALVPVMVTNYLDGGASHLAWLQSAFGVGMVCGGLALGAWGGSKRRAATAALALAMIGVGMAVMGAAPATAFPLSVSAWFCVGFMIPMVSGSIQAMLQATVPPKMQGRVFALVQSASSAMSPLGMAIAGPVADVWNARLWYVLTGVVMITLGVGMFFVPAIMRLEDQAAKIAASVGQKHDADAAPAHAHV